MTAATYTQANEEQDSNDVQANEKMEASKEAASPEHLAAINEAKPASQQPDLPALQADSHPDWSERFMPVTLDYYHQQLHQPRHQAEPQRRLTLPIPERLHREIKVYCAQQDLQLGTLIAALLQTCFYGNEEQALSPLVSEEVRTDQRTAQEDHQPLKAA